MNEVEKLQAFQLLRERLPNAFVTYYQHDILAGITLAIDENGRKTKYNYDEFSRLKNVLDHEGNILNNYVYQFLSK